MARARAHQLLVLRAVVEVVAVVTPHGAPAEVQYSGHEQPPVLDAERNARARFLVRLGCRRFLAQNRAQLLIGGRWVKEVRIVAEELPAPD
jgi:hypothetical protein